MFLNKGEYLTVADMAEKLGKTKEAVKTLLKNKGFKALARDALYPVEAFNAIKNAPPPGRPRKGKAG